MNGIAFFEKNKIDLDENGVTIAVTDAVATDDGSGYVDALRDRRNWSGWSTTDSTDAANTTFVVEFNSSTITDIFLINMNWKAYTIKYWDGVDYVNFSTTIAETVNTANTKRHTFTGVSTDSIQIIITGAMTVDDDKYLSQLIITQSIGQFTNNWVISKPKHSKKRKELVAMSGRSKVYRQEGAFSMDLQSNNVVNTNDLNIVESLYDYYFGFLVWPCGGDTSQFRTQRIGFRLQDIYLMNCSNEYTPEWADGFYNQGTNLKIELVETL